MEEEKGTAPGRKTRRICVNRLGMFSLRGGFPVRQNNEYVLLEDIFYKTQFLKSHTHTHKFSVDYYLHLKKIPQIIKYLF